MSDEEIRVLCVRLGVLLADPHPGLATWTAARNTAAQRLRDALNQVCEAPTTPTDPIDPIDEMLERVEAMDREVAERSPWAVAILGPQDAPVLAAEVRRLRALREVQAAGATIAALAAEGQRLLVEARALVAAARQRLTGPEMRERIRATLICSVEPAAAESAFVVFGPDAGGRFADAIMALLAEVAS